MQPSQYPRRILFSLVGLFPQTLTETLFALAKQSPNFIPTEIWVITTKTGADKAKLALFKQHGGWFHRLCNDYSLEGIAFEANHILTIVDAHGNPLEDIRSPEDNRCVANQITQLISRFTQDQEAALHVSIAGGRKTMGFYAGYALSLFGREQDRLSHVLVDTRFETHSEFYYPTPYSSIIDSKDGSLLLEQKEAWVELAELPIIKMRSVLDDVQKREDVTFENLVDTLQEQLEPLEVSFDTAKSQLIIGEQRIALSKNLFAFYVWMAERKAANRPGITMPLDDLPDQQFSKEYLDVYYRIYHDEPAERTRKELKSKGMSLVFIEQSKTRIASKLKEALGINAKHYTIVPSGEKPFKHGLLCSCKIDYH
jgi:CRISPR-associated protein (TIGR02584 family)